METESLKKDILKSRLTLHVITDWVIEYKPRFALMANRKASSKCFPKNF